MDSSQNHNHELFSILDSFGDKQFRRCNAVLLFSFEDLLALLDIQFRELWDSVRERRRRLPTFKTAQKLFTVDPALQSMPTLKKHLGHLPLPSRASKLMQHQFSNGYSTTEAVSWLSFMESSQFSNPAVLKYWEERLYQVSDLFGIEFESSPLIINRLTIYNSAHIVACLGCPESRTLLGRILSDLKSSDNIETNAKVIIACMADRFSALLRLAAWSIAQEQVENWDLEVSEGGDQRIHAAWAIPKWCNSSNTWSNPMDDAFDRLAKLAGWSGKKQNSVTFLGKAWAHADGMDEASRIRLLRNWLQLKPGRPSFKKMLDLVQVCFDLHSEARGGLPEGVRLAYWQAACWFRFAETMAIVVRDVQKQGWPTELVTSMLSVYESEYRVARDLLGKPIHE